jgi:hypothetical protein
MNRAYLVENLWNEYIVPVFIERFLLVVCAATFYGLVITNAMNFSNLQRIGMGCTLVGVALFLGATVHKQTHPPVSVPPAPAPTSVNSTTGPQSPIMPNNGGSVTINGGAAPTQSPPPKDKPK